MTPPWAGVAAVLAGLAAALVLTAPVGRRPPPAVAGPPTPAPAVVSTVRLVWAGIGAATLVTLGLPTHWWVPAGIALGAAVVGGRLWTGRAAVRERAAVQRRVLDLCEHLAGDLGAGQPAGSALTRAVRTWPMLAPVGEAARVGADVPAALRRLSGRPGAEDLRLLAAAWQVAHRTGQGLAGAVDRVGLQLVEARSTRRLVQGELSSARATARLVAALPVVVLAMGSGVGGEPVAFLLLRPAGWACLAGGLALGLLGLAWIEAIARDVEART